MSWVNEAIKRMHKAWFLISCPNELIKDSVSPWKHTEVLKLSVCRAHLHASFWKLHVCLLAPVRSPSHLQLQQSHDTTKSVPKRKKASVLWSLLKITWLDVRFIYRRRDRSVTWTLSVFYGVNLWTIDKRIHTIQWLTLENIQNMKLWKSADNGAILFILQSFDFKSSFHLIRTTNKNSIYAPYTFNHSSSMSWLQKQQSKLKKKEKGLRWCQWCGWFTVSVEIKVATCWICHKDSLRQRKEIAHAIVA